MQKQQADQRMIEELVEKTKVLNVALSDDSLRVSRRGGACDERGTLDGQQVLQC